MGIDPCHENLIEVSSKALKKPAKGGLPNLLFVLANVENMPDELTGITDRVYINFPWGSLLQGIVLGHELTWNNIKKICNKNATIETIFGYHASFDKKEIDRLELPPLDESYLKHALIPRLRQLGFATISMKNVKSQELRNYSTTWAKKLSYGQDRSYYQLTLRIASNAVDTECSP